MELKHTIRELIKQGQGIYDDFNRLNPDGRLTLRACGVSKLTGWCTIKLAFCDKRFKPEIHLEDKAELAIDLVYFAFHMGNRRFSNRQMDSFPSYEVRVNTLKKPYTTSLRTDGDWKRIPFKLARLMIEYQGLTIVESNREAYETDSKYIDWFRFNWNEEHYEGLLEDYEIPSFDQGVF